MGTTYINILQVLIPIALGFAFRLGGLFGEREGDVLRRFCIRFTLPVFVFFSFYDARRSSLSAMVPMVSSLILLTVVLFVVGWLATRFVQGTGRKSAVHLCVMFGNYGWMGYGVAEMLLGPEGFLRAMFFTLLWWPVFYSFGLGVGFLHGGRGGGKVPVDKVLKVALPPICCFALGITANMAEWQVPELMSTTLRPFGQMTIPLLLFSVGCLLDLSKVRTNMRAALLISAFTLCVTPFIGWALASVLARDPVAFKVIILQAAMPVATVAPVLADNYEIDLSLLSTAIALSTALSFVTIPVVALIVL